MILLDNKQYITIVRLVWFYVALCGFMWFRKFGFHPHFSLLFNVKLGRTPTFVLLLMLITLLTQLIGLS